MSVPPPSEPPPPPSSTPAPAGGSRPAWRQGLHLTVLGFAHYQLRLPPRTTGVLDVLDGFGKIETDCGAPSRFCGPCRLALPARCRIVNLGVGTLDGVVCIDDPCGPCPTAACLPEGANLDAFSGGRARPPA